MQCKRKKQQQQNHDENSAHDTKEQGEFIIPMNDEYRFLVVVFVVWLLLH